MNKSKRFSMAVVRDSLALHGNVLKETLLYTVTSTVRNAISFVLLLFVSYYMPPDELGIATNFLVLANVVSLFAGEAVVNSLPYFFYEQSKDKNTIFIAQVVIYSFLVCLCILLVILIFSSFIESVLKIGLHFQLLSLIFVIGTLLFNINTILYRLENKPITFALTQIAYTLVSCVIVVVLVIQLRMGGAGKILSDVLSLSIFAVYSVVSIWKRGYWRIMYDREMMKRLVKFAVPLLPHSIASWINDGMNKIFITSYCGLFYNGLYSMALTLTIIYKTFGNSFFNAYTPYLQEKLTRLKNEDILSEKKKIVVVTRYMWLLFIVIAVISLFAGWFVLEFILDERYKGAFVYLPYMLLSICIYYIYSFALQLIYKMKKTFIMGVITFGGSILQTCLSYVLIKEFGAIGSVYSAVISSIMVCICIFIYSNHVYPMPWLSFKWKES